MNELLRIHCKKGRSSALVFLRKRMLSHLLIDLDMGASVVNNKENIETRFYWQEINEDKYLKSIKRMLSDLSACVSAIEIVLDNRQYK